MSKMDLTRRQFCKTAGAGIAALGMLGQIPSLGLGGQELHLWIGQRLGILVSPGRGHGQGDQRQCARLQRDRGDHPGSLAGRTCCASTARKWSLAGPRPICSTRAYNGMEPFKAKQNVLGWFAAYPGLFTIAVRKGAGHHRHLPAQGQEGGPGHSRAPMTMMDNVNLIFKNCGIDADKDLKPEYIRFPDAVQKMIDGHIDACSYFMGIGVPGYVQLADSTRTWSSCPSRQGGPAQDPQAGPRLLHRRDLRPAPTRARTRPGGRRGHGLHRGLRSLPKR